MLFVTGVWLFLLGVDGMGYMGLGGVWVGVVGGFWVLVELGVIH